MTGSGGHALTRGGQNFDAFFRRTVPDMRKSAMLLWPDRHEAEDAVQQAYLELYRHWDRVCGYESPEAWVRMVMFQRLKKARTAWGRRQPLEIEPPSASSVAETAYVRQVLAVVHRLPARQRQVMVLYCLEGMAQHEIAELTGLSRGGVASSLRKARVNLAKKLGLAVAEDGDGGPALLPPPAATSAGARLAGDPLITMLKHAEERLIQACAADADTTELMLAKIKEER
ncbi:sigma-70 family RNA polymerase sigma factor [Actinomadura sp. 21ATH]|uniref:sigma-70 family RNA polymerase sigma factor n=1 Tax=Actinomadura sp. 21ATH TaxID=1735444 RepID=UPI0035C10055